MNQRLTKIKCDECKKEFLLEAVGIDEAVVEINNVPVTLVYFACPKCNKIYRVSIQDKRYYELKEDLEKTKKKVQRNQGGGNEEMARVLSNMVNNKLKRLKNHVDKVNKKFNGTFTFVVSENNQKEKYIKYLP